MGDDVSVGAYVHISAIWFELRTFENHRDGRICRQEVGVFTVDRFGRPSLIFEDLSTFHTRKCEERDFSLGNVEGRAPYVGASSSDPLRLICRPSTRLDGLPMD